MPNERGTDTALTDSRTQVLSTFLEASGTVVDSSPMYGSVQNVMGYALKKLNGPKVFSADKIWTRSDDTAADLNESGFKWGIERFDLMQVPNLLNWEEHLPKLLEMKKEGKIRYVGITTSHGRRHSDFESVMKRYPLDFVQLTYNVDDREVERRLLPLAKDRNIAVLANRPFQGGTLPDQLKGEDWHQEPGPVAEDPRGGSARQAPQRRDSQQPEPSFSCGQKKAQRQDDGRVGRHPNNLFRGSRRRASSSACEQASPCFGSPSVRPHFTLWS